MYRPTHKLFVCGSAQSGKRTLKNNWSMTSWSAVVEKIANVEIVTCQVIVCLCVCVCCVCACVRACACVCLCLGACACVCMYNAVIDSWTNMCDCS